MANFTDLQAAARRHAQVDSSIVSQTSNGDEESHCREAVRTYSQVRPYVDAVSVAALSDASQPPVYSLSSAVTGWVEDSWTVVECYQRSNGECERISGWSVIREAGVSKLIFDSYPGQFWLRYARPHDPDDDPFLFPREDLDAISHLAAALILEQAADYYGRQYNRTMGADSSNTEQQSFNYAQRAKDQRKIFTDAMAARPKSLGSSGGAKRANWSTRGLMGRDHFWTDRWDRDE